MPDFVIYLLIVGGVFAFVFAIHSGSRPRRRR